MSYIPDITERFPEGFNGIDMTPKYFGEPVDYDYENKEPDDVEIPYESKYETIFKVGQEYTVEGIFGGLTIYIVKDIDRVNNKILLAEMWEDLDGSGERDERWHNLEIEDGKEKCLEFSSKRYGDFWLYAKTILCND